MPTERTLQKAEELIGTGRARSIRLRGVSRSGAPRPQAEHRGDCSHPTHRSRTMGVISYGSTVGIFESFRHHAKETLKRNNSYTDEHDGAKAIKDSPRYFQIFLALVTEPTSEIYVIVIGITL